MNYGVFNFEMVLFCAFLVRPRFYVVCICLTHVVVHT